ncbi:MAG: iron ABC transporter substrate-binding protein, partial [Rhodospirillaceae bacterium]|nr:iron ABC transporter substrate-binding protein [Rhodospirillaceae bacterium]
MRARSLTTMSNKLAVVALGSLLWLSAGVAHSGSALAEEVNLYSSRQPFLMKPLLSAFTAETGVKVNMVYLKKGM